jgi:DNA-directed RNA polymerase subunit beta'
MLQTSVGQLLVNDALPREMRDYTRKLDKKGINNLLQSVAEKYPDEYKEISHRLSTLGHQVAYRTGGFSFGLEDLAVPPETQAIRQELQTKVQQILADPKLDDEAKNRLLTKSLTARSKEFESSLYDSMLRNKNPLATQVQSGARGSPGNLRSIIGGDLLYEDHHGRPIPVPILRGYAQGMSPVEYWASSFGTRKGVADLKFATQEAGFFGKQLNQIAHRLIVSANDHDVDKPEHQFRGLPVDSDDPDNEGALLAQDVGHFKRNTVLTPRMLREMKAKGTDRILIRSPLVGGPPQGGLYARDVGVRDRGGLSPVGDYVGMAAAQALSEPVTQAQISSKHTGGVAGAGASVSGFKYINQLVQVPKTFQEGAAHSTEDGKVGAIWNAPAGGKYLMINGVRHYVHPNHEVKVKVGDTVEAGDVLSDGIPNPAEIVRHKGIGEGRRYFTKAFKDIYSASGIKAHRRNIELVARGLINHVRLTDELGDYVADDVVPYDVLEHAYKPRNGHEVLDLRRAVGKYLERPVLHYSIGTKVRPSMLDEMRRFKVNTVVVHDNPPPFEPEMIRGMESLQHDPDWMTRQLGSNLKKSLLTASHRGASSDELGSSFVPPLARAVDFGRKGLTKGWDPKDLGKS